MRSLKTKLLLLFVLSTTVFPFFNQVIIYVKDTRGEPPFGPTYEWWKKPGASKCLFIENGLHYNIWMTDEETGKDSDNFMAGDKDYGYSYKIIEKGNIKFGALSFLTTNFALPGRKEEIEFSEGDALHIRMQYMNQVTGKREVWALDTVLTEQAKGAINFYANLTELTQVQRRTGYDCFTAPGPEDRKPNMYFADIYSPGIVSEGAKLLFGVLDSSHVTIDILDVHGNKLLSAAGFDYQPGTYVTDVSMQDFQKIYSTVGLVLIRMKIDDKTIVQKLLSFGY